MKKLFAGFLSLISGFAMYGQEMDSARWDYVESIVQYDADTRYNILLVSEHADLLADIGKLQKKTQTNFQGLIKPLAREEQEVIYKLLQQEGLFQDIMALGENATAEQVEAVLKKPAYNTDLTSGEVYQLMQKNKRTLQKIKQEWETAVSKFNTIISEVDTEGQEAFRALVKQPEVMEVLNAHLDYTKELGQVFVENPDWVIRKTDSLAIFYQTQHEQEVAEYQKELESNPELQKETVAAAEEYAREFGYDPEELKKAQEAEAAKKSETTVVVVNNYQPYPYWFGYPYWYPMPMWHPYPWYYQCGFYFGPGGGMVVFGMPSYHYSMWFYRGPYVHYHACVRYHAYHHHRYPYSRSGFNNSYRQNNITINNNNISVGGRKTNINTGNRYDFNKPSAQPKPTRPAQRPTANRPSTQPAKPVNANKPAAKPAQKPAQKPATKPAQRPTTTPAQRPAQQPGQGTQRVPNNYRANDYHRSNWNQGGGGSRPAQRPAGGGGGGRRR